MITVTPAKVKKIVEYKEDLREYILVPEKYRNFRAGTFLQLSLDSVTASDYWPESRTFSIANAFDKNNPFFRLLIRKTGKYTARIFDELKKENECTVKYAFGDLALPKNENREAICIAGGSGIAPFIGFLEESEKVGKLNKLSVFYSAKTASEMLYKDKLSETLKKNFKPYVTREKTPWAKNRRISIPDVLAFSEKLLNPCYYVCGSPAFITFFKKELNEAGKTDVFIDEWE